MNSSVENIQMTDEQESAFNIIRDWTNKRKELNEDYVFALAGAAGTGKSTLAKWIIDEAAKFQKVAVTAPTHKAKEVIAEKTGRRAETIQSLLGLRPNVELADFDPNKPEFSAQAEERIKHYSWIAIDESSIINDDAFTMITEKAAQYGTMILFIGDKYQLPPINEKLSKVFLIDNIVYLEEIIRQKDTSPNLALLDLARKDVKDNTDNALIMLSSIKNNFSGNEGYSVLNKEEFYDKMLEFYYDTEFEYNSNYIKTLCYTNIAATQVNNFLRKKLVNSSEQISKGDRLMGYKTIAVDYGRGNYENILINSKDYIVEKSELTTQVIANIELKGYIVNCIDTVKPMFILHRHSYADFVEEYNERLYKATTRQRNGWQNFYNFKNQVILMENIYDENRRFICGKDLDYGYAITVHKSQGSTYDNVAIFLNNINTCRKTATRRKLTYVALSRTSGMNIIYNG